MDKKLLYVSIFSFAWALNIVLGRYILKLGVHPLALTYQSLLFSAVMIFGYLMLTHPKSITKGAKKHHVGAIVSGVIGGGLANIFATYGLGLSTATNYGFLIKTAGAFNVLLAFFILKEPIGTFKATLLAGMLGGAYLLSTGGQLLTPHFGDVFILLGALGYGLASVLNRKVLKKDMDPNVVSFYRAGFGFIVSIIAAIFFGGLSWNMGVLGLILLSAFFQALLFIFLNKTLQVASSSYVGMLSMSVPVIVAIIAVPLFGDSQTPVQWLGSLLIVLGGVLTEVKRVAHHA